MIYSKSGKLVSADTQFRSARHVEPGCVKQPVQTIFIPTAFGQDKISRPASVLAVLVLLILVSAILLGLMPFTVSADSENVSPGELTGSWEGSFKLQNRDGAALTMLLSLDEAGRGQAFILTDGVNLSGAGLAVNLSGNVLSLTGNLTGESSQLLLTLETGPDGYTLSGMGSTGSTLFTASFLQTTQESLTEKLSEREETGKNLVYSGKWYEDDPITVIEDAGSPLGSDLSTQTAPVSDTERSAEPSIEPLVESSQELFGQLVPDSSAELVPAPEYGWVMVEVEGYELNWETVPQSSHNYAPGSYSASLFSDDSKNGMLSVQAEFVGIPEIIYPDQPVSLNLSFSITENTLEPMPARPIAGADFYENEIRFTDTDGRSSFSLPNQAGQTALEEVLTASIGVGEEEGQRVTLRTLFKLGGRMTTYFIYEWQWLGVEETETVDSDEIFDDDLFSMDTDIFADEEDSDDIFDEELFPQRSDISIGEDESEDVFEQTELLTDDDLLEEPRPGVIYENELLVEVLQGEWVSDPDADGYSYAILIQDDMYAFTVAAPKREEADLSNWHSNEYWDLAPWDWFTYSVEGNVIAVDDGSGYGFSRWVYTLDDDTIWLSFSDIDDPAWSDADYLQLYRVRSEDAFDFATYLEGKWISGMPFAEANYVYLSVDFLKDGTGTLSYAYNVSGDPDVTKRQLKGWQFEVFQNFNYVSNQDGFTITHTEGIDQYELIINSFASARFVNASAGEDILLFRAIPE